MLPTWPLDVSPKSGRSATDDPNPPPPLPLLVLSPHTAKTVLRKGNQGKMALQESILSTWTCG